MSNPMLRERVEDLSVYYFIKTLFSGTSFITIEDGFPSTKIIVPCIAVEGRRIDTAQFELGNKNRVQYRVWDIDIFANNKSQRDEIGYTILNALEDCIPVYDYNEGFPPPTPTRLGCLETDNVKLEIVKVSPLLVDLMHWRATVSFTATFDQI